MSEAGRRPSRAHRRRELHVARVELVQLPIPEAPEAGALALVPVVFCDWSRRGDMRALSAYLNRTPGGTPGHQGVNVGRERIELTMEVNEPTPLAFRVVLDTAKHGRLLTSHPLGLILVAPLSVAGRPAEDIARAGVVFFAAGLRRSVEEMDAGDQQ